MYTVKQQVSQAGLYRCTTCGVMIPVDAGETLPGCPSRCADAIWTYFNEKWTAPEGETRIVLESFSALDIRSEARQIPAGARLTDISLGPQPPYSDPKLAAFHYSGQTHFTSAYELFQKTRTG